ncbi:MAG: tRNA preQ1(34) S-adenosylmethionine ribosyltransferase-isomerase QueA [Dehalococcoidia bacterium]
MRTDDFDYDLPDGLIAQSPAEPRDSARLMVVRFRSGAIAHHHFRDLPELLRKGDLLVVNDTRVMAARLHGARPETGGRVEALLLRPFSDRRWQVLFKPGRQAQPGRRFRFETTQGHAWATIIDRADDTVTLEFDVSIDPATAGSVPLPPYIRDYTGDAERYQTVYSREARSAAAPTAGLHFTPELLARLDLAGISRTAVTLEVGAGTFKPVTAGDPRDHVLHQEHVTVPEVAASAIRQAKSESRRVVAVGTTVVRTLEHVARERGAVEAYAGWTGLKILPGEGFAAVEALVTNFHLPKSTLLMLVCAFAGQELVLHAYREAVAEGYRFYSFGDAMLLLPE